MPVQVRLWAPNDNKRKGLNIEKPPENERLFLSIIITTCLEQFYFKTLPPALNGESKFRLRLRGGRRKAPPEHLAISNSKKL